MQKAKEQLNHVLKPLLVLLKQEDNGYVDCVDFDEVESKLICCYHWTSDINATVILYSLILSNDPKLEKERLDLMERQQEISEEIEETEAILRRLKDARRVVEERIDNDRGVTG